MSLYVGGAWARSRADLRPACSQRYLFGWSQSQSQSSRRPSASHVTNRLDCDPDEQDVDGQASGTASDYDSMSASFATLPTTPGGGTRSGYVSGYTTEEPDYDEVIGILSREQAAQSQAAAAAAAAAGGSSALRRTSRSRSRSQLDLTALNKDRGRKSTVHAQAQAHPHPQTSDEDEVAVAASANASGVQNGGGESAASSSSLRARTKDGEAGANPDADAAT